MKTWTDKLDAGTPVVKAEGRYDAVARSYTLTLSQSCPATPGQPQKAPFVIPLRMGLVGPDGRDLPLLDKTHMLPMEDPALVARIINEAMGAVPDSLRGTGCSR